MIKVLKHKLFDDHYLKHLLFLKQILKRRGLIMFIIYYFIISKKIYNTVYYVFFFSDRPDPPAGQPAASAITRTSVTLSWYGPGFDGGSQVIAYRIDMAKAPEYQWSEISSDCQVK